jgi:hypothetical protein
MHPAFLEVIASERSREIREAMANARRRRPQREAPKPAVGQRLALRLDRVHDHEALLGLAELEGRPLPEGPFVVGEVDGAIVAAMPLLSGATLADPFRPTAEIIPLMALRVEQLSGPHGRAHLTGRAVRWIASRG